MVEHSIAHPSRRTLLCHTPVMLHARHLASASREDPGRDSDRLPAETHSRYPALRLPPLRSTTHGHPCCSSHAGDRRPSPLPCPPKAPTQKTHACASPSRTSSATGNSRRIDLIKMFPPS